MCLPIPNTNPEKQRAGVLWLDFLWCSQTAHDGPREDACLCVLEHIPIYPEYGSGKFAAAHGEEAPEPPAANLKNWLRK
jgi:hypothetical protein